MHTVSELQTFRKAAVAAGMTDEDVEEFVDYIADNPVAGDEIVGTGGFRQKPEGKSYNGRTEWAEETDGTDRRGVCVAGPTTGRSRRKRMSKKVFDEIAEGLNEALAVARGEAEPYKLHVPAKIDVKAIRAKAGLSQKDFASTFGFGFDQLKQWEQGRSRPVHALRAYLLLINARPVEMVKALRDLDRKLAAEEVERRRNVG